MADVQLMGLLNATLQAATLLFIAALGELITEKSGILNLGVEGMILLEQENFIFLMRSL